MVVVVGLLVGVLLPTMTPRRGGCGRQLKDQTQLRGMVQSMIVWAGSNRDEFPLPSRVDQMDATVAASGRCKDTTGNILSLMIYQGYISPELCVSPAESNLDQVQKMDDYQYERPKSARNPAEAQWDPRFRGTPLDGESEENLSGTGREIGNQSYAHLVPIGRRLAMWRDGGSATQPVVGNRGPEYAEGDSAANVGRKVNPIVEKVTGRPSKTLLIHGGRSTWEGHVAYADGSVRFETNASPEVVTYTRRAGSVKEQAFDNLFVNESDEVDGDGEGGGLTRGANAYLRPIARMRTLCGPWDGTEGGMGGQAGGEDRLRPTLWKD